MTILELLVWILIAIIAFYVLKLSLAILIIIIAIIVVYYVIRFFMNPSIENYKSTMPVEYSKPNFGVLDSSRPKCLDDFTTSHPNYLYIPMHQYYENTPLNSISEYCVQQHLNQYTNLESAIQNCQLNNPISTSIH